MGRTILRSCACLEEAIVTDALLRDGGFLSSIDNYHYSALDWSMVPALGGVRISVPEALSAEARNYLIEMVNTAPERLESVFETVDNSQLKRSRWRAYSMLFLFFGGGELIALPLFWLLTMLPSSWFPVTPSDGTPYVSYYPHGVGATHANFDTLPTTLILLGIIAFTASEMMAAHAASRKEIME